LAVEGATLICWVAGDHIQISPPYTLTEAHADRLVAALDTAIQRLLPSLPPPST
jgi:adenosylmethionine-8-amino-7-oxononanoate aminotransferase